MRTELVRIRSCYAGRDWIRYHSTGKSYKHNQELPVKQPILHTIVILSTGDRMVLLYNSSNHHVIVWSMEDHVA